MRITKSRMEKLNACGSAMQKYFSTRKGYDAKELLELALENEDYSNARWVLSNLMSHPQQIKWTIYCAEQVIKIYEDKYPDDSRPRNAIKSAKKYLKYPTQENKDAAASAASAAYAAASAAAYAASASTAAADARATYAAAYVAAATAYAAQYKKTQEKLLRKGLAILLEVKK